MSNKEAAEKLIEDTLDGEHTTDDGSFARDQVFTLSGIGYALLDVADAIREQTAALTGDDKRAVLIERNQ